MERMERVERREVSLQDRYKKNLNSSRKHVNFTQEDEEEVAGPPQLQQEEVYRVPSSRNMGSGDKERHNPFDIFRAHHRSQADSEPQTDFWPS